MDLLSSEDQDNIYRDIMFHVDYIPTFVFVEIVFILSTKSTLKSCLEYFYFEIHRALSEIPANLPGQFSLSGQMFCTGQKQRMVISRVKILIHL